ncbi:MAG: hypothetical protein RR957_04595, partial [Oscillospiraceae bacterium]
SELLNEYVDVFVCIIPEIIDMVGFEQLTPYHNLDVWKHTLKAIKNIDGKRELRLAVLLHDIGKPKAFTVDKRG